jgi:hypothetical protein
MKCANATQLHRKFRGTWVYDRRAKPILVIGQCAPLSPSEFLDQLLMLRIRSTEF